MERIILDKVSKKFVIGCRKNQSALERALSLLFGKKSKKELFALKNISLKLKEGENLGVIGRNGSGKSTLLRVIAGVYIPDEGIVKTNGKIIYLTGFGLGLNHKLTMRENIYLMGSVFGLSQKHIKENFNQIVEFSGLGDFLDTKIYQFSSGMIIKLNFSVALHCIKHSIPDILLLDEIFAAGDFDFKKKTFEKLKELIDGGASVILATHDLNMIKKYFSKAILLEKGEIVKIGSSKEVVKEYLKLQDK